MRKGLIVLLGLLFVIGASGLSYAAITGSDHDWSYQTGSPGQTYSQKETQICRPCHVPHNLALQPMQQLRLLWAQTANWTETINLWLASELWWSDASRTVPTIGNLPTTLGEINGTKPAASIRFCLSCHADRAFLLGGSQYTFTAVTGVGPNLRSDHPVNVDLSPIVDGSVVSPSVTTIKLVDGKVVCRTCHNAHNEAGYGTGLLTYTMTGSLLCRECHPK